MNLFTVDGYRIELDIMELLSEFAWHRPKWTSNKLIVASPFRDESHPSFFVDLESGGWKDSGAYDDYYASGNLAKLLAYLRNETYEEALEYLVETYGVREPEIGERLELPTISLKQSKARIALSENVLTPLRYRNPYLANRGISEPVQRYMGVGYDRKSKAVTMPWRHPDGVLANIKYRRIDGKLFWYYPKGAPIRTLVYGIDKVYEKGLRKVIVCEAEIDAMSWMTCGVPAIALGGVSVSAEQIDLIRRSSIELLIRAMDNDKAGESLSRGLGRGLRGYVSIKDVELPKEVGGKRIKDANDALKAGLNLRELLRGIDA